MPSRSSPLLSPLPLFLPLLLFFSSLPSSYGVEFFSPSYSFATATRSDLPPNTFQHVSALFAPDPNTFNSTGRIWYSSSNPRFCSSEVDPSSIVGRIVLAQRDSECNFLARAQLAEGYGAIGLIIGDNKESTIDTFDVFQMGPQRSLEDGGVSIPVILVTARTFAILLGRVDPANPILPPPWSTTTATIGTEGLLTEEQFWASQSTTYWNTNLQIVLDLSPFAMVLLCYYTFYMTWRPTSPPARPAAPVQQAEEMPQPQQAPAASEPAFPPSSQQANFNEHEIANINLPVPPHLSSDVGMSDVALDVSASSSSQVGASSSSPNRNSSSNSLRSEDQSQLLDRPLLPLPSVAVHMKLYYHLLKCLSAAGKPLMILRLNGLIYAIHALSSLIILIAGWDQRCNNERILVSLWCARALIGFRVCFWQCNSNAPLPTCADIFFKNWADCIFIFSGSMFAWNDAQRTECEVNAPTLYKATQAWTTIIYITYGLRIILYLMDRYSQRHTDSLPHLFTISARSLLNVVNGGFSCAGALDKNQPATQLDLMLIPTVTYRDGMYPPDDAVCGVCLGEYSNGETLRLLNCSHHFHGGCVDTWLLQKSTCPTCRAPIDQERVVRRSAPPVAARAEEAEEEEDQPHRGEEENHRPPSPSQVEMQSRYEEDGERVPPHAYYHQPATL